MTIDKELVIAIKISKSIKSCIHPAHLQSCGLFMEWFKSLFPDSKYHDILQKKIKKQNEKLNKI